MYEGEIRISLLNDNDEEYIVILKDRFTVDFEYVFFFAKNKKYYFQQQFEPIADSTIGRGKAYFGGKKGREYNPEKKDPNYRNGSEQLGRIFDYKESCKNGRNKRTVWTISTKPFKEAHFAVFPYDLIETPIKAGCPKGGIVLDPFMGAGTTAVVAKKLKRHFIGFDINTEYCDIANKRIVKNGS